MLAFSLLVIVNVTNPPAAEGLGKIQCKPGVGMKQIDPIVARGSTQSAHMHEFFSNKFLLTMTQPWNANYSDLVNKATTCKNPGDSAAYWVPAMRANGNLLPAERFIAYYRSFNSERVGPVDKAYPPDMRIVANHYNYTCGQNSSMSNPVPYIPDCSKSSGTTYLTQHIDFPTCWDGQLNPHNVPGDTTDNSHLRYFIKGSPDKCPVGFPIRLPELRMTTSWGNGSPSFFNGKTMRLDSDMAGMQAGTSTHGDFWNTWNQAALEKMINDCIRTREGAGCNP